MRLQASALTLAFLTTAWAQSPQHIATSPEIKGQMKAVETTQPGPPHGDLMKLAGTYSTHSKFYFQPGSPPQVSDGWARLYGALDGRFLIEENGGGVADHSFKGLRIYGYNNGSKRYEGTWTYTGSTSMMSLKGTSRDGGKTVEFIADFDDDGAVPPGTRFTVTMTRSDNDHLTFVLTARNPDGSPGARVEEAYTRKK